MRGPRFQPQHQRCRHPTFPLSLLFLKILHIFLTPGKSSSPTTHLLLFPLLLIHLRLIHLLPTHHLLIHLLLLHLLLIHLLLIPHLPPLLQIHLPPLHLLLILEPLTPDPSTFNFTSSPLFIFLSSSLPSFSPSFLLFISFFPSFTLLSPLFPSSFPLCFSSFFNFSSLFFLLSSFLSLN